MRKWAAFSTPNSESEEIDNSVEKAALLLRITVTRSVLVAMMRWWVGCIFSFFRGGRLALNIAKNVGATSKISFQRVEQG